MSIAQTIPIAYWGMHGGGWWILGAVVMMLFMGGMMWMMMRGMGDRSWQRSSAPSESRETTQSALEILERRFRKAKSPPRTTASAERSSPRGPAESNGAEKDEPLAAPSAIEGRQ